MKRILLAAGVGTVAVTILVLMAIESRPIPAAVHIAQNALRSDLDIVSADYHAINEALQSAWDDKIVPGDATRTLIDRVQNLEARLDQSIAVISDSNIQIDRIVSAHNELLLANQAASKIAHDLHTEIGEYNASVTVLHDTGPSTVQKLTDLRFESAAADTFELVMGTLDYSTTHNANQREPMQRLVAKLEQDQGINANMPREIAALRDAATTVLESAERIETNLREFQSSPVTGHALALQAGVNEIYAADVNRRDRARLLLAIYAMLLLASVGLIAWRLKESYRDVAQANENLSALNESLEVRVEERTRELEGTLEDLKESQVQLVQAEKMSSLGQLVAGISHEINTPLLYLANNVVMIEERITQIQSFVQRSLSAYGMQPADFDSRSGYQQAFAEALNELKKMLDNDELDADVTEARDLLEDCRAGLEDLTEMAQSLKDFSRLDRAPIGNFNVNTGLDKTLVIAKNMVKDKAQITKYYGEVPEIECSPSKINQVFLNLISNAAQAINANGEIILKTEAHGNDAVAISVSDTGCGIPEDILDRIRDPFFTTKEVGSGTGLGLSIVEEIIRSHGGDLRIESEVGKGSKFTVILPTVSRQSNDEETQSISTDSDIDLIESISPDSLAEAS